MTEEASPIVARPPRKKPSPIVESEPVRRAKRHLGLWTIWVPTIGTLIAIGSIFVWGFGMLELGLLVGMYVLTMAGVEVGFHRQLSHRAFESKRWLRILLAIAGSMAAQGRALYWVATHRRHHVHSDTPDDPHSPHFRRAEGGEERMNRLKGLWHAHIGNMYTGHPTNCTLFARDIIKDPDLAMVDRHYWTWVSLGLVIPFLLGGAISASWVGALQGLLWGGFARIFLVHHVYFANGSFSHMYGGQPFDNGDFSTNNPVFAIPTFGSAYQNNHHAFPHSAHLGLRWYQVDVGAWFIRLFRWTGLAWNIRRVKPEQLEAKKRRLEDDA